ncbi:MAG: hypothetical protein SH847_27155 [Roseiflexaceae bacterium]|nr:hypothetical protein [Roseiflexaceae bacterium]
MAEKPHLHVLFTINCPPPGVRANPDSPRTWEHSARAIEGFCVRTVRAGYPPTLFAASACVDEQAPLFDDVVRRGAEVGLFLHPPEIGDGRFSRYLGQYSVEDQRSLIEYSAEKITSTLGLRPRSFRSGFFSASNVTFRQLFELGFRQGSLSEPGRRIASREAVWDGAIADPHYINPEDRLRAGTMPFLEIPVTTNPAEELARGMPHALQIEAGNVDALLQPTIERHLARMQREDVAFRVLCITTSTRIDYYSDSEKHTQTLEKLFDWLETLAETHTMVPVTAALAHERFRVLRRTIDER